MGRARLQRALQGLLGRGPGRRSPHPGSEPTDSPGTSDKLGLRLVGTILTGSCLRKPGGTCR